MRFHMGFLIRLFSFSVSFRDNGDGTVTDMVTGLMWQQADLTIYGGIKDLSLAGHGDWRLPTREELLNLWKRVGSRKKIRSRFFPIMKDAVYWTSDGGSGGTWGVNFHDGGDYYGHGRQYNSHSYVNPGYRGQGFFYSRAVRRVANSAPN